MSEETYLYIFVDIRYLASRVYSMKVTPIDPYDDPRVEHKTAQLNGHTYHYLLAVPKHGNFHNTIFLVRFERTYHAAQMR